MCHLAVVAANAFLFQFRVPRKTTSDWISSVGGIISMAMISEEDQKPILGMDTYTSMSESVYSTSIVGLKVYRRGADSSKQ